MNASKKVSERPQELVHIVILFDDNDVQDLEQFEKFLLPMTRVGCATIWHRGKTLAGDDLAAISRSEIARADLILLLLTANFTSAWDERAVLQIEACNRQRAKLVPILLRPATVLEPMLSRLQVIPRDGHPVLRAGHDTEERFHGCAVEVHELVKSIIAYREEGTQVMPTRLLDLLSAILLTDRDRHAAERRNSQSKDTNLIPGSQRLPGRLSAHAPSRRSQILWRTDHNDNKKELVHMLLRLQERIGEPQPHGDDTISGVIHVLQKLDVWITSEQRDAQDLDSRLTQQASCLADLHSLVGSKERELADSSNRVIQLQTLLRSRELEVQDGVDKRADEMRASDALHVELESTKQALAGLRAQLFDKEHELVIPKHLGRRFWITFAIVTSLGGLVGGALALFVLRQ